MADENQMGQNPAIRQQKEEQAERATTQVHKVAEDLRSAAGATAAEYRSRWKEVWHDAVQRARSFQEDSKQYVRDNPTKAIFTALVVGFVLGLTFRR